MAYDTPFSASPRVAIKQDENSIRFAKLKPICVELLGLITSKGGWQGRTNSIHTLLIKLKDLLASFQLGKDATKPLSPSLINYIFFPLAQLLRENSTGSSHLPDRLLQQLFETLTLLSKDWWRTWSDAINSSNAKDLSSRREQWKVWEQLLILGAATLEGNSKSKSCSRNDLSEETQLAVTSFLYELLLPRVSITSGDLQSADWEWDGEERLPSLDDYDSITEPAKNSRRQLYPSPSHLEHIYQEKTSRGAIAHAISSALSLASDGQIFPLARVTAVKVARLIIDTWLGGPSKEELEPESELIALVQDDGIHQEYLPLDEIIFGSKARADRTASFLPGFVSSMVRILTSKGSKTPSTILSQALQGLSNILIMCLNDAANRDILAARVSQSDVEESVISPTIESLVEKAHEADKEQCRPSAVVKGNDFSPHSQNSSQKTPVGRNLDWLENTVSHVVIALHSIKGLALHDSSAVQIAMLDLALGLLHHCNSILCMQRGALREEANDAEEELDGSLILLRWILDIAGSSDVLDIVASRAREILVMLFSRDSRHRQGLEKLLVQEIQGTLMTLPDLLESQKDDAIYRKASRLAFAIRLATLGYDHGIPISEKVPEMLSAVNHSTQWLVRLLWSLNIDSAASSERGTINASLKDLSVNTSMAVMSLFFEIGRSCARLAKVRCEKGQDNDRVFELIATLLSQGSSHRNAWLADKSSQSRYNRLFSQNALLVAAQLMRGAAEVLDDAIVSLGTSKAAKKLRKVAHRLAKEVIGKVCAMWDEDEEELLQPDLHCGRESASNEVKTMMRGEPNNVVSIEHRKGLLEESSKTSDTAECIRVGPALRLDFLSAATMTNGKAVQSKHSTSQQLEREASTQLNQSDALLMSILASSAKILGPSIQPLLLQLLYPIICGIASSSNRVQSAAALAMDELSRSAGFASVQACVSSHADYVLGTASHRLISSLGAELQVISTLRENEDTSIRMPLICAQSAPLVLIEVIRMLGGEALTLVQDAIDEVLDAIDRYHQQPSLCDNLLGVLDRLVEVMHSDERIKGGQSESIKVSSSISAVKMAAYSPDIERDMADFEKWWGDRSRVSNGAGKENEAMDDGPSELEEDEEEEEDSQKPSSSQLILVSILQKAVPFLTHSSATIRIRSLRLLNRGIELLCLQGRTVEPLQVMSTAWPIIMARVGFSLSTSLRRFEKVDVPSYDDLSERDFMVCIEACKLINTLSKHLIDFLGSEKMLRQAVPRLLLLLKIVERAEGRVKETTKQERQSTFLISSSSVDCEKNAITTKPRPLFQPIQRYTPLYTMAQVVLVCLDTIINAMGPQITEAELFAFATHPTLLNCLDCRQDEALQKVASRLYLSTMVKRNENLVWLIIKGAKDEDGLYPAFLHRPDLQLPKGSM